MSTVQCPLVGDRSCNTPSGKLHWDADLEDVQRAGKRNRRSEPESEEEEGEEEEEEEEGAQERVSEEERRWNVTADELRTRWR